jgi:Fic family protein
LHIIDLDVFHRKDYLHNKSVYNRFMATAIKYHRPEQWIKYDKELLFDELANAKASVLALKAIPFQKRWVETLQKLQLKMEVAGTSQIEGADFAGNELDTALKAETAEEQWTRSQKQANAAVRAYRWIATLPDGVPVNEHLICDVHRIVVTDCDEDHCAPGQIRTHDQNVTFGYIKHRGASGGPECTGSFKELAHQLQNDFPNHDQLIQALALHYHFAAMHPFQDGNGRTARVLEALMLQRAGLKNSLFIAMSNYYYEEKRAYLQALADVRAGDHNLTPFLKFALKGIAVQSNRLLVMIRTEVSKQLFRNLTHELFARLETSRKRVIVKRQLFLLEHLLDSDEKIEFGSLVDSVKQHYASRKIPFQAIARDVNRLISLGAIRLLPEVTVGKRPRFYLQVNLDWPSTITETEFFAKIEQMPKSKTSVYLLPV